HSFRYPPLHVHANCTLSCYSRRVVTLYFFSQHPPPPRPTLFPYTTLFRSTATRMGCVPTSITCRDTCVCVLPENSGCPHRSSYRDRKSTRLNSSHVAISYAVFCLKKKKV